MPIKILEATNYAQPIRTLKIWQEVKKNNKKTFDFVEKYRLVRLEYQYNEKKKSTTKTEYLFYAKGKINFNLNPIKDGSGKKDIPISKNKKYLSSVYAFYKDGFYTYENKKWIYHSENICKSDYRKKVYESEKINGINEVWSEGAIFLGWYTKKTGGEKITSITDIYTKTNLFKKKKENTLPTITLYAHWKIDEYKLTIGKISSSSPWDGGFFTGTPYYLYWDKKKNLETGKIVKNKYSETRGFKFEQKIPYGIDLIDFLKKNIISIEFYYWRKRISITEGQKEEKVYSNKNNMHLSLIAHATKDTKAKFIGWSDSQTITKKGKILKNYYIKEHTTLYPQFEPEIIHGGLSWALDHDWATKSVNGSGYYKYDIPPYQKDPLESGDGLWTCTIPATVQTIINHFKTWKKRNKGEWRLDNYEKLTPAIKKQPLKTNTTYLYLWDSAEN